MARTIVTTDMINKINELYYYNRNKSAVAREMGISASTVSKYIVDDYIPKSELVYNEVDLGSLRKRVEDFILSKEDLENSEILMLQESEKEEIRELWKELSI